MYGGWYFVSFIFTCEERWDKSLMTVAVLIHSSSHTHEDKCHIYTDHSHHVFFQSIDLDRLEQEADLVLLFENQGHFCWTISYSHTSWSPVLN